MCLCDARAVNALLYSFPATNVLVIVIGLVKDAKHIEQYKTEYLLPPPATLHLDLREHDYDHLKGE
jgi:hypothetical protein